MGLENWENFTCGLPVLRDTHPSFFRNYLFFNILRLFCLSFCFTFRNSETFLNFRFLCSKFRFLAISLLYLFC